MRGSYPDAPFLSRTTAGGLAPPINGLLTPPRALNIGPAHRRPIHVHRARSAANEDPGHRFLRCRDAGAHPTTRHARLTRPHPSRHARLIPITRHAPGTHPARTRHAPGPPPTHTKRARTNRSGRATYSAQALGRLPWFAPCLRRSRRLRPRFDMSFSLGLLSRLKHFCTH